MPPPRSKRARRACWIASKPGEAFDLEIKALQARKALVPKRADWVEEQTLELMRRHAFDKLEGILRRLIARPAPVSLLVTDKSLIPAEYLPATPLPGKSRGNRPNRRSQPVPRCRLDRL